jgi:AraC-like DNA-binding protein
MRDAVMEAESVSAGDDHARLAKSALAESADFALESVECDCVTTGWSAPEAADRYAIVFVRRGCFRRRVNGIESFLDPTTVYFERPGDEQQIAHPAGGDSCMVLYLSEPMLSQIWGESGLPDEPRTTDATADLRQRLLLAALLRGDEADLEEAVIDMAAGVLEKSAPKRVASRRPATALARRRLVNQAREAVFANPHANTIELARGIAASPHHLSRVFRAETGQTISRYRNRLRVRLALERLAQGEPCLARLAADLGFADQGHLARVIRRELDMTPSLLRGSLAPREIAPDAPDP